MKTNKVIFLVITIILALSPLFWLKDHQINLGGDSSRIYFYQPRLFIVNYVLYGINPWNIGQEMVGYFIIPFAAFLQVLLSIVKTSHNLISVFNSMTLFIAFISTYASIVTIIRDTKKVEKSNYGIARTAGVIGGLFYIFAPTMTNWDKALLTFNQTFLDPLLFFLLYKYFTKKKIIFALLAILITFIFAPNFSFIGAPSFFSFYPFVILYLIFFARFILKITIDWRQIWLLCILFLGIQAFHLIPQLYSLANPSSIAAQRVFSGQQFNYVEYFDNVSRNIQMGNDLLGLPQGNIPFSILHFIFPLLIIFAGMKEIKIRQELFFRKNYLLLFVVFLLLLFFMAGRISTIGFVIYSNLFRIPGFGMFRNFDGQFVTAYFFFYALLIGMAFYIVIHYLQTKVRLALTIFIFFTLFLRGLPLLNGSMLYLTILQAKNDTSSPFVMSRAFQHAVNYIASLQDDTKILTLPMTDFGYQMLAGKNGGLYIGPSLLGVLTSKKDFTGTDAFDTMKNLFLQAAKERNGKLIRSILAIFNIHYVFWDSSIILYNENFPNFPYDTTKNFIQTTPAAYQSFIRLLSVIKTISFGHNLQLLTLNPADLLPKVFPSNDVIYTNSPEDSPYLLQAEGKPLSILPFTAYNSSITHMSFEADNSNRLTGLKNNVQFHTAIPEVSWQPGSFLYPLVIWKEENLLKKQQGEERLNLFFLDLAKRVEELHKWGSAIPILGKSITWTTPKIWQFNKWKYYNSWEGILAHYVENANNLISVIHQSSSENLITEEVTAMEQFEQHRKRIKEIIPNLDFPKNKKNYLFNLTNKTFNTLEQQLNITPIDMENMHYSISLPESASGTYALHVIHPGSGVYTALAVNNHQYPLQTSTNDVLSFGQTTFKGGKKVKIDLLAIPNNLAKQSTWIGPAQIENNTIGKTLKMPGINLAVNTSENYQIPLFPSAQQYLITFEYQTHDNPFELQLVDKQKTDQENIESNIYTTRTLQDNTWQLFQTVFTIDPNTISVGLELQNSSLNSADINIRNFNIIPVDNPIVTIQRVVNQQSSTPSIFFQRINPTKYKISITNGTNPYILNFLDAFSKNWKLYFSPKISMRQINSTNYFGGVVSEGNHTNTFFDPLVFETWYLPVIPETDHFNTFGYANAWIISPYQLGRKKSYEFILELQSQRSFYIGSLISVIFLGGVSSWVIGYIIYFLYKNIKKRLH